jgi:hypothetical protein
MSGGVPHFAWPRDTGPALPTEEKETRNATERQDVGTGNASLILLAIWSPSDQDATMGIQLCTFFSWAGLSKTGPVGTEFRGNGVWDTKTVRSPSARRVLLFEFCDHGRADREWVSSPRFSVVRSQ